MSQLKRISLLCISLFVSTFLAALPQAAAPDPRESATGHYEGTATNKAGEVITVAIDLKDTNGALSGNINSSHGDFPITNGTREGDNVTINFDTGGDTGSISLKRSADKLVGSFSAGDDGGPGDLKKVAAPQK